MTSKGEHNIRTHSARCTISTRIDDASRTNKFSPLQNRWQGVLLAPRYSLQQRARPPRILAAAENDADVVSDLLDDVSDSEESESEEEILGPIIDAHMDQVDVLNKTRNELFMAATNLTEREFMDIYRIVEDDLLSSSRGRRPKISLMDALYIALNYAKLFCTFTSMELDFGHTAQILSNTVWRTIERALPSLQKEFSATYTMSEFREMGHAFMFQHMTGPSREWQLTWKVEIEDSS